MSTASDNTQMQSDDVAKIDRLGAVYQELKDELGKIIVGQDDVICLLYTSPSPRDRQKSRMPSSA